LSGSDGIRLVNPIKLHLRCGIETDIYKLNRTLDHKLNINFINGIQEIRRGSSWNPNQRGLVAHDNIHHYKTIEKYPKENKKRIKILYLEALVLDPCLVLLTF